jgi:hypothetical protein
MKKLLLITTLAIATSAGLASHASDDAKARHLAHGQPGPDGPATLQRTRAPAALQHALTKAETRAGAMFHSECPPGRPWRAFHRSAAEILAGNPAQG